MPMPLLAGAGTLLYLGILFEPVVLGWVSCVLIDMCVCDQGKRVCVCVCMCAVVVRGYVLPLIQFNGSLCINPYGSRRGDFIFKFALNGSGFYFSVWQANATDK